MIFIFVTISLILSGLCSAINKAIERDAYKKAVKERQRELEERERMRLERAQQIETERCRKEQYKRMKAEQMKESILTQIEQNQELYSMIEHRINGNISESQRISCQRQLMTIDNRIYRLNNQLMDLEYQLA